MAPEALHDRISNEKTDVVRLFDSTDVYVQYHAHKSSGRTMQSSLYLLMKETMA